MYVEAKARRGVLLKRGGAHISGSIHPPADGRIDSASKDVAWLRG